MRARGGSGAGRRARALLAALVAAGALGADAGSGELLDGFDDLGAWSAAAYPGVAVSLASDAGHEGRALRMDFDFRGSRGYAVVRRPLERRLPENWAISFELRAAAQPNDLEIKLVDEKGESVWWRVVRDWTFPLGWERVTVRKDQLRLAWGEAGREPERIGAIEIAVTAGSGGRGSVWIDDLRLEEREPSDLDGLRPRASASSAAEGSDPGLAVDRDATTAWRSAGAPVEQWLELDLGRSTEYGGLVVAWDGADRGAAFRVLTSMDRASWAVHHEVADAGGEHAYVPLPDATSRYVRLELLSSASGRGYGIREVTLQPWSFSETTNSFLSAVAREAPRGHYPRHLVGEQIYWTVVGANGDPKEGLLSEDGQLEVDRDRFSIEPFLRVDGALGTWADVEASHELERGYLPIPTVVWKWRGLRLRTTAFAARARGGISTLYARYRVENPTPRPRQATLFLALRPFQVNPAWQSLNMTGGVAPLNVLSRMGRAARADLDKAVVSLTPPDGFGAAAFDAGPLTDWLAQGTLPPEQAAADPRGLASGAFRYELELPPAGTREVWLAIPFHLSDASAATTGEEQPEDAARRLEETIRAWEKSLSRVAIALPPPADELVRVARTTLAYVLVNRDGPALQPGSRDYERSWIRDGAFTSAALLEMGYPDEVRDFLRWYARYQYADGRIPCCVDDRGPDPVEEHDSNGEFIFAVTDYYRYTLDRAFLEEMWPHVVKAVAYIGFLREQTLNGDGALPVQGLAPPSISHEGYSAHPVHSYWDDFFLLRGLKDAVVIARELGDFEHAERWSALRDAFRADLYRSLDGALAHHQIDFIPGSVELGDFDPTSTSMAISPADELANLPQPALVRTFERYFEYFLARRSGAVQWQAYTPYELRNVGSLVRLGRRDLALQALEYFLADRRPLAWNGWGEVVWRDPRHPGFLGDQPHTWVGSGFLRSFRTLLVYESEPDEGLVLAAGVPRAWVDSAPGVVVRNLPTWYGPVSYTLRAQAPGVVRMRVEGRLHTAPARIRVVSPYDEPLAGASIDGRELAEVAPDGVTLEKLPADVELRYAAAGGDADGKAARAGGADARSAGTGE